MILLIDNFDSFVYNLARYCECLGHAVQVVRNDACTVEQIRRLAPDAILLSPGPGTPDEAGVTLDVVRELSPSIPMLGVCLGHQAMAQAFGADVIRCPEPMHGRASWIEHTGTHLFAGLPNPLRVGRYHSLMARRESWPEELEILATLAPDWVMAIRHRTRPLVGVQFHPESILTQAGYQLLARFLADHNVVPEHPPLASPCELDLRETGDLAQVECDAPATGSIEAIELPGALPGHVTPLPTGLAAKSAAQASQP